VESLKINYIMFGTGRTGGVRTLFNFMNELVKLGHEVTLTTLYYSNWFPLSKDIKIISSTKFYLGYIYLLSKLNKSRKLTYMVEMVKKLMDMSPKADVHVATFSPTAYAASWKSVDGSTPFYHMQHFETLMFDDPIMKKFVYDTYFLPIYKVANSSWLQKKVASITGVEYPIVYPAVEHDIFYPRNMPKEDGKVINIVALGKGGWKNAMGIYKAYNLVRKKIPEKIIILHFYGSKPPKGIDFDNKNVIFHKNLTDEQLAILYSSSDIQITFSTYESFPLPPLEAMASGCAVVTTPYGTEDYAIDNYNALIVEPNNVEMLAEKIILLIEDESLRKRLIENGLKTASKFTYSRQAKILEENIKKAIDINNSKPLKNSLL